MCCFETLKLWNFSLEFRKKCSEHRFENEKSRLNQAITRKIAKNNEKSMKNISKIGKKNFTLYAPYMCPIYALYAPYMAHILSARARARARPALVDVGPPALTHKRELNYFHTRARRQMGFFSSLVSIIFHNCGSFFAPKMLKLAGSLCNSLIHDVHLR